jgi:NAD(P)-dependent dehydrogenase (short-subunit alcohol dehydrogenase family)
VNDSGLRGRVFVVTGSGRGLGAALARAAGAEKARVVVNCCRDVKAAEGVAADVEKTGGEAIAVRADVTVFEEARALVDETIRRWGRIDVLANTVGTFHWSGLVDTDPGDWRGVVASNLDSVFNMCRLVVPHMRERRFGRIVNFAAVGSASTQGEPEIAAYSAAKAGVIALSRSLASATRPTSARIAPRASSATASRWATRAPPKTSCGPSSSSPPRPPAS